MNTYNVNRTEVSENQKNVKFWKLYCQHFFGVFYVLLSSTLYTTVGVIVKRLIYIDTGELTVLSFAGSFVFSLPIAVYCDKELFGSKEKRVLLLVAACFGSLSLYFSYLAIRYMPLADAVILRSTMPVMTSITACIYLKENCGLVQSFALVITIVGVAVSVRLPELLKARGDIDFDIYYILGLCSTLGCVICLSLFMTMVRYMQEIHYSVVLINLGWIGTLTHILLTSVFSSDSLPICGWDHVQVALIGLLSFLGNLFFTLAVQKEEAGIISIMKSSFDIIVAMVFQIIFFNLSPDIYNIVGSVVILVPVAILGTRKLLLSSPENSNARLTFKCLI